MVGITSRAPSPSLVCSSDGKVDGWGQAGVSADYDVGALT